MHILDHGSMHCDLTWLVLQGDYTLASRSNPTLPRQWVECPTYTVLIEHPDVAEAAVVPSPDARRLTVPKAFIVLRAGVAPGPEAALAILRFAREQLAPYKRIRRVEFAELPKTISGKIQRNLLRQLESEQVSTQLRPPHSYGEEDFPELAGSTPEENQ